MEFSFKPRGVCSREIKIEVVEDTVKKVEFVGGCKGNTQGVARLCVDRKVDDLITLLDGIQCRSGTSCPDQLAKALKAYKQN
ncbi:MAG: TIGR03905 family TSCPD domain-containing protein [Clostridia bacterium]|nr:TIGR03905 family TSCPD domain-containing protein [Clostridia bacterium]